MRRLLPIGGPIAILLLAIALSALMLAGRGDPVHTRQERETPGVEVIRVTPGPVPFYITAHGTVRASRHSRVSTDISGRVVSRAGDLVTGGVIRAGETLVQLDDTDYTVALAEAEAARLQARLDLADKQARYEKDSLSLRQSEAALAAAEARVARARRDLDHTRLRAPFTAVVTERHVEVGQFVTPGSPLVTLAGVAQAEVDLPLTPREAALVAPLDFRSSLNVPVTLTARLGHRTAEWAVTARRLHARVVEDTRTLTLTAVVDDPYGLQDPAATPLPLGLFVEARIEAQPAPHAVRLPRQVLHEGERVYVVTDDNRLEARSVSVYHQIGNDVIISDGLDTGDRVVLTRLDILYDGMPVTVIQP